MQKINDVVLRTFIKTFAADRKGVTAIEYGLIAGLIAVAIIAAITALGGTLGNLFNTVNSSVSGA
jgi:pilus assembly protein Flp/PilA